MTAPKTNTLSEGKKIYFASDFHLGVPSKDESKIREQKIIRWLDTIKTDAESIYLVGDIFDFWFEYRHTVPKGFIRLQGKLAELKDRGINIYLFTGNHDMWMFGYFTDELDIPVYREPIEFQVNDKRFYVGHGDGLGPGDYMYKIWKKIFSNRLCQFLFGIIHPDIGIGFANYCSRNSRLKQNKREPGFLGEEEWLLQYCKELEKTKHHDYYIFGHRHLPLNLEVGKNSNYINLGEWVNHYTYAVFDGKEIQLKTFEE